MIGGFTPNTRRQDIESRQILLERLGIKRRQIPSIHPHSLGAQFHFVVTRIGVRREMSHIRDIHHMLNIIAVGL